MMVSSAPEGAKKLLESKMNRQDAIKSLKAQIAVNINYPHAAEMVKKQQATLASYEAMTDAEYDTQRAAARSATISRLAADMMKKA